MVASKYLYDEGEDEEVFNDDWAKAGKKLNFFVCKGDMNNTIGSLIIINSTYSCSTTNTAGMSVHKNI